MQTKVLVVDDDEAIRVQLKWALGGEFEVFQAGDPDRALDLFNEVRPSVVTLDLGLPPFPENADVGLAALQRILTTDPRAKVIVLTGNGDRENALRAVQLGAIDYYLKPIEAAELRVIVKRAAYIDEIERENETLRRAIEQEQRYGELLGMCRSMQEVFGLIERVAPSDEAVLIQGESGTGKELVARAIHGKSARRERPFIPINCAAIPEQLMESELFGHEKGAFTGAYARQRGKLEMANGGTVFLDEVGEMTPALQVKILRFLQDHLIQRVGGQDVIPLEVRVLAATNSDIEQAMSDGRLREDLYYRLSVVVIRLPPLRARGEDIPLLANAFLARYVDAYRKPGLRGLSPDALKFLQQHKWPGNVRELENRMKRAVLLAQGPVITVQDLGMAPQEAGEREAVTIKEGRERVERRLVCEALRRNRGNVTRTALDLGLSRPGLHNILRRNGIDPADFR
jgi:two-component system NtrC family response regulator